MTSCKHALVGPNLHVTKDPKTGVYYNPKTDVLYLLTDEEPFYSYNQRVFPGICRYIYSDIIGKSQFTKKFIKNSIYLGPL